MTPWELLDEAAAPDGARLRLWRRGAEFSIRLPDGNELMNSRLSGSEEALARLAWARIADRPAPCVLIGGLGMGFTLRAALALAGPRARVTVAELVGAVIDWARGPMAALHGDSLRDPRLALRTQDVAAAMAAGGWDAILLDVDNGPDGLTRPANGALYAAAGLAAARRSLRPGGVLAVWSAHESAPFAQRLRAAGFAVDVRRPRGGRNGRGPRHVIWLATAPGASVARGAAQTAGGAP